MKALVWHGAEDVKVDQVPDPVIQEPNDAIIRVTSSGLCGSDLHLYGGVFPVGLKDGDILGHEPMGIVEEVGPSITNIKPGDRVVVPFNISCGHCHFCQRDLQSQCETTQVKEHNKGASLFGYTHLYGGVAGGQAEFLRVPQAQYGPIKVPEGPPDTRFLYLSDVLPTAWQGVAYNNLEPGDTIAIWGLGPIGQMAARIAKHRGLRVIGVDRVPERLALAERYGVETIDESGVDDPAAVVKELTQGRGAEGVLEAVGMEAHGGGLLSKVGQKTGIQVDRLDALRTAMGAVRRGGSLSISGVYAGLEQNFPLGDLFDKQITLRMGQANVRRWVDDILPLLTDEDPLGVQDLATHLISLDELPKYYEIFQKKEDGAVKVVVQP